MKKITSIISALTVGLFTIAVCIIGLPLICMWSAYQVFQLKDGEFGKNDTKVKKSYEIKKPTVIMSTPITLIDGKYYEDVPF